MAKNIFARLATRTNAYRRGYHGHLATRRVHQSICAITSGVRA